MLESSVLAMLACPACRGALEPRPNAVACMRCGRVYPVRDGIPVLLIDEVDTPRGNEL